MDPPTRLGNLALVAFLALLVTLLFGVAGSDLPTTDPITQRSVFLPGEPLAALAILGQYVVVGWAGLSLVYTTIRRGRALGRLSHEPFTVDVFDPTPILPFGNIALAVALAPAGVILILLAGFGLPNAWLGWTIVLLSALATMLALLLPLRGIHRQMLAAKQAALKNLNSLIAKAYGEAIGPPLPPTDLARLTERTNTLIPIRKTVQEMTTWPFRDTVALGRALLIASAPLIYTAFGQLINVLYINPLRP
jgi:hypothetical protein